jgi:hypothetical protein
VRSRLSLVRGALGEAAVHLFHKGRSRGRGLELRRPSLQLTLDVPLFASEVAKPHRVRIHAVQVREHVDERAAHHRARLGSGCRASDLDVAHDDPVDERHDVERRAVHVDVVAHRKGVGHRHRRRTERRDDLVLAADIVCGGQHRAQWRTPKDHRAVLRIVDPERQIRPAACDQGEFERLLQPGDVVGEPAADFGLIDAGLRDGGGSRHGRRRYRRAYRMGWCPWKNPWVPSVRLSRRAALVLCAVIVALAPIAGWIASTSARGDRAPENLNVAGHAVGGDTRRATEVVDSLRRYVAVPVTVVAVTSSP